jgi:membrane fusion protein, multidrug efflux system
VRIQLLDADPRIKLGMTAQVRFKPQQTTSAIIVPTTAVTRRQGDHASVWVIDAQHKAHARQVTTGALTERGIEITSGLQSQETIATIGVHTLTEGMPVQAVTPAPEVLR